MALNGYQKTKEVYINTLQHITTPKGLKAFKADVCCFWCNIGAYCNECRCSFGRAYNKRLEEVKLLEEQREIREKQIAIKIKDRFVSTKHQQQTRNCLTALKRSCTCALKKEKDTSRIEVLEKINKNIQKGNKQMVAYYAKKYDFANIIEILDRYNKKQERKQNA